ncbi:hypothetical protein MRX96_010549 [Rhipicephalus microplus]
MYKRLLPSDQALRRTRKRDWPCEPSAAHELVIEGESRTSLDSEEPAQVSRGPEGVALPHVTLEWPHMVATGGARRCCRHFTPHEATANRREIQESQPISTRDVCVLYRVVPRISDTPTVDWWIVSCPRRSGQKATRLV